jgi:maltose alpha-D-glucosyltransferase/alpha-amylase
MDTHYPGRILLCEANMWPEDVRPYFGDPAKPGEAEFQMGFHFPIMPRIFMALKKGDVRDMVQILDRTPPIPDECQWCTFLRNHDELTLEMVTDEERHWMWDQYAPEPRMRLNLGIRRRLAPLLDNDRRKIEVANSILFTLTGSPIIYYGDEIGMGDNIWLDDRNGVRTPMQWDSTPTAGFSGADSDGFYAPLIDTNAYRPNSVNAQDQQADPKSLFNTIRKMIEVRKQYPVFGRGSFLWVDAGTTAVAAYMRQYEDERLLILQNLSDQIQSVVIPIERPKNLHPVDILHDRKLRPLQNNHLTLSLAPYRYLWLKV